MTDEKKTYLINIESNLKKYADEAAEAKKKVDELKVANDELTKGGKATTSEIEASKAALKNANAEYTKAQKMVQLQVAANNSEKGSRKQLNEILTLQMQELGKLGNAYITNAKGVRELNPLYVEQRKRIAETKQAIIDYDLTLNDGRSNIGRYGDAVQKAFVDAGKSMLEMLSPAALIATAMELVAKKWKEVNENIDLYLESAKKVSYGSAGFLRDSEAALADATKRAKGGVIEGNRLENEAKNRLTLMTNLTEEQKAQLQLQIKAGQKMQEDNYLLLDNLGKNKEKGVSLKQQFDWKQKYSELLKEEKIISNDKLVKEIEWAGLEAKLTEQRAIAGKEGATELQIKNAAVEADKIATELAQSKIMFINTQIDNITALADMTAKQAEEEDKVNGLLKERNNVQREYYANQIKINRIGKTKGTTESIAAAGLDMVKTEIDKLPTNIELKNLQIHKDLKNDELAFNKDVAAQNARLVEDAARISKWEAEQYILDLDIKRQAAVNGLSSIASILGEQTELGKAFAVAAATIDTYGAAAKALNDPTIPSTLARVALMSSVILAGIANVKQIMSVKVSKNASAPSAISSSVPAQRTYANPAGSTILTQQQLSQNQLNALPNQNLLTADDIARALSKMPPPVVTVEDINAKAASKRKIEVRANI